ncbi:MAG: hypothetical protein ACXABO_13570 [Promethearchaeota archaeon]
MRIPDVNASFWDFITIDLKTPRFNKIGVATPNKIHDEILFTATTENYTLSILSKDRIVSPEILASFNNNYRNHIPINFNTTHAYTYENGSTIIKLNVKNTGDIVFGIHSVYLTESLMEVDDKDFNTTSGDFNIEKNAETNIIINATNYIKSKVNEEILVCVTGSFITTTVTSDIGYIHSIKDGPDIQLIESIEGSTVSYIYANETGKLMIKNTGDQQITLDEVFVNSTLVSNVTYLYGNPTLNVQEVAVLSFHIPDLKINVTNDMIVNITTTSTAEAGKILQAYVDPGFYNITIDDSITKISKSGNMTVLFTNYGRQNVTIESIYINGTYIPLANFYAFFNNSYVKLTSTHTQAFEIGIEDSMRLTRRVIDLELIYGPINVDDKLEILIRTEQGAEIIHEEVVT